MDAAMITVMQIHLSEPEGDILLFLTGVTCGVCEHPHSPVCCMSTCAAGAHACLKVLPVPTRSPEHAEAHCLMLLFVPAQRRHQ